MLFYSLQWQTLQAKLGHVCYWEFSSLCVKGKDRDKRKRTPHNLHCSALLSPTVPITSAWDPTEDENTLKCWTPSMRDGSGSFMFLHTFVSWQSIALLHSLSLEMLWSGWISWTREVWISVLMPWFYLCPADLFSGLDSCPEQGIINYGVSMTTLEDVFLKLEGEAMANQEGTIYSPQPKTSAHMQ